MTTTPRLASDAAVLVVGAAGFVGSHAIECLARHGYTQIHATCLAGERVRTVSPVTVHQLDILDPDSVRSLLGQIRPDFLLHLAAQSSVALSWERPADTVAINVLGFIHVLEAVHSSGHHCRTLIVGSSEQYGHVPPDQLPVREDHPLAPDNPYAIAKSAQEEFGLLYARSRGDDLIAVRAFNHFGPGQSERFALSGFARKLAEIELGIAEPQLEVGNLDARRDFTDVRDIVEAYRLLLENGQSGKLYNVGSGVSRSIGELLEMLIKRSCARPQIVRDPQRMRPSDLPEMRADTTRIREELGWRPTIPLEQTLDDLLSYWRQQLSSDRG